MTGVGRILIFAGGLCGAAGVGLAAAAAHLGGGNLQTAANLLLFHAPALLAIGLFGGFATGHRVLTTGAFVLLAGVALFSGDLAMREFPGHRLFAMAAPAGGMLMIAGWLTVAASAFASRPDS